MNCQSIHCDVIISTFLHRANGHLVQMGTWGPMDIRASGHWGKMGIGGKWAPEKITTRAYEYLRQMGTLEQMGTLGTMSIGAVGHWGQRGNWGK